MIGRKVSKRSKLDSFFFFYIALSSSRLFLSRMSFFPSRISPNYWFMNARGVARISEALALAIEPPRRSPASLLCQGFARRFPRDNNGREQREKEGGGEMKARKRENPQSTILKIDIADAEALPCRRS